MGMPPDLLAVEDNSNWDDVCCTGVSSDWLAWEIRLLAEVVAVSLKGVDQFLTLMKTTLAIVRYSFCSKCFLNDKIFPTPWGSWQQSIGPSR